VKIFQENKIENLGRILEMIKVICQFKLVDGNYDMASGKSHSSVGVCYYSLVLVPFTFGMLSLVNMIRYCY